MHLRTVALVALLSLFIGNTAAESQANRRTPMRATGTFEVKLTPQKSGDSSDKTRSRMSIAKQFHGDIEGRSEGEMLTATTAVKGSAGYVAIERVTGSVKGRRGTFVLQHNGIMDRGKPNLIIVVVPDSGTGELAGLTGKMAIKVENGKHYYDFEYVLP